MKRQQGIPGFSPVLAAIALLAGATTYTAWDRSIRDDPHAAHQSTLPVIRIDLNRASVAELRVLPGIGDALAVRIVADRQENGPFRTVDDLVRVHGIGEKTVERLQKLVQCTLKEPHSGGG